MKLKHNYLLFLGIIILNTTILPAQIRLPHILGSNMVLQRNQVIPIWGWAKPNAHVIVTFAGQQKQVNANSAGYWKAMLKSLTANAKSQTMTITSDTASIILTNVLVGEVWLASGQSNMEFTMKNGYAKPAKGVDSVQIDMKDHNSQIRLFMVGKTPSKFDVTTTGWNESGDTSLERFSAPAYYFAKNLHNMLNVPIGIISSSVGGSRIEAWTPVKAYTELAAFKNDVASSPVIIDHFSPGNRYKSMIEPLAPFCIRGFLWYQGEANCLYNDRNMRYADKMQALITSWRKLWGNDRLPFNFVLIAPYRYTLDKGGTGHKAEDLPEFWEQQMAALKIPKTELIDISDCVDNVNNIHPSYKWIVGRRLAQLALAKDYNQSKVIFSGPRYKTVKFKGNKAIVAFNYANGLKSNDGKPIDNFIIAGSDGKFFPANAQIIDEHVVVSSPDVDRPVTLRFAWNEAAQPNLVNNADLPAFPFRTDSEKWIYKK